MCRSSVWGDFMAKEWYIIQVFTGYEQKVEGTLNRMLASGEIDSNVLISVKNPTEVILVEDKNNKPKEKKQNLLPAYLMLEMDLPQLGWKDTCTKIRRIQGVSGFCMTKPMERPRPISASEARNIFEHAGDLKPGKKYRANFSIGDRVTITSGSFSGFEGVVETINEEREKLVVIVHIFNRPTPVDISYDDVEKI